MQQAERGAFGLFQRVVGAAQGGALLLEFNRPFAIGDIYANNPGWPARGNRGGCGWPDS